MSGWSDDVVLVPVPLRWAQNVMDHLNELKAGRSATPSAKQSGKTVHVPDQGDWNQPMVPRLVEGTHYAGVLALIDRCAVKAGQWVTKGEVESELGITPIQLRNELGAFSKLTKKLFGTQKPTWPVEWKKERGIYLYRMDPLMAEWWTAARGASV